MVADINPERRYRLIIQAENAAGRGPESRPYFFDTASAGRCCYVLTFNYVRSLEPPAIWRTAAMLVYKEIVASFCGDLDEWKDLSIM